MDNITILINTSDGFEDCWDPFFKLFNKYWKGCKYPIVLNTEFKNYIYENNHIKTTKVNLAYPNTKLTWSECLIFALNQIETPLVLYMQEDYFIDNEVNTSDIEDFIQLMLLNKEIAYIGLTDGGNYPPFEKTEVDKRLLCVNSKGKYRISTQAAIWRKDTLLSYLLPHENGWMFEIFGTYRSHKRKELFLTIDRDYYKKNALISYILTGIIKSKWHKNMPDIFKKNGIDIDFNKRGFYNEKPLLFRKVETAKKLLINPINIYKSLFSN
jgi:hypothetical protein